MRVYVARFQFFSSHRLTDRQNRLLNPASRMRARGKDKKQLNLKNCEHQTCTIVLLRNCTLMPQEGVTNKFAPVIISRYMVSQKTTFW